MGRKWFVVGGLLFVVMISLSGAKDLHAQTFPERPTGFVNDYAGMLNAGERQNLERRLSTYRDTTSNVIVVTTVESLQGVDIETFATTMFNNWKMWEGDRRNGVLLLISQGDRQMRIEVGYGLEGVIPDIAAGRIIRDILTPAFQQGRVYDGLIRATDAMMALAAGEYTAVNTPSQGPSNEDMEALLFLLVLIAYIAIQIIVSSRRRRGHSLGRGGIVILPGFGMGGFGRSGGGFGGGGFGGFGGGGGFGSGGGGASGRW